jgi:hypothetical protein
MEPRNPTVPELARELGQDPKLVRAWMREQQWRSSVEKGAPWLLTSDQVQLLRVRFAGTPIHAPAASVDDPLAALSVEELLDTYRNVLASLRLRGLVRTNNAPIGDLAEYCAAIVYDGVLAPNSEKSYDLVADDGRRIQVKVRLIRPSTSPSAVFSPIRSFDFDACLFLLANDERGSVELAREWGVADVQELGKHRAHTNGVVVRIGKLRTASVGIDRTAEFETAWREMLGARVG